MQLKSISSETICRTQEVPLEIKAGAQPGTFEGYGSIYDTVDRDGDIVTRGTFTKSLKMRTPALLWQHNPKEPIGRFDEVREDAKGLYVKGRLTQEGRGKEAYELLKMGALNGLSVGFVTKESVRDDTSGVRTITKADLMEISLVTFPANELARVHAVKSASFTADAPTSRTGFLKLLQQKGFDMGHAVQLASKGFFLPHTKSDQSLLGDDSVLDATIMQLEQSGERIADILWGGHETKGFMANQVKARFNTLKTSLTQAKAKSMTHKVWVTSDDNTRASHGAADGQKVAIGQSFNVGGKRLFLPCDPGAPFSETANCKCTVKYETAVKKPVEKPKEKKPVESEADAGKSG